MIDFYNIKNWKTTHMKEYSGHLCLPPLGTKIFNANIGAEQIVDNTYRFVFRHKNGMMQLLTVADLAGLSYYYTQLSLDYLNKRHIIKGRMNWLKVQSTSDDTQYLAVRLPVKEYTSFAVGDTIANKPGLEHGDGDYIVCPKTANGTPNLRKAFVINGLLFPLVFSRQAFRLSFKMSRYVAKIEEMDNSDPEPLFPPVRRDTYGEKWQTNLKSME